MEQRNMRRAVRAAAAAGLVVALSAGALVSPTAAGAVDLKAATITPQNSAWGRVLESTGAHVGRITDGEINVRFFHNGIAGGETDVIRKMRLRQIDIGVFTSIGLGQIVPEALAVSAPGLFKTNDEVLRALDELEPEIAKLVDARNMKLIGLTVGGWVYPFSKSSFSTPEDFTKHRLAFSSNDEDLAQLMRNRGYNTVTLSFSERLTALNNGLVGSMITSPVAAAAFQWFGVANKLLDIPLAPFLGAIIITDSAWRRISASDQAQIKRAIKAEMKKLSEESLQLDRDAISTMEGFGLEITVPTTAQEKQWRDFFDIQQPENRDARELFDGSVYAQARELVLQYRSEE